MNRRARPQTADADAATPRPGARDPGQGVAFVITLHVRPGKEAEFLGLLRPVLDAMRHETTFINAVLHRDPDDPTRFMLYETWADLDDVVQVQIHREYRKAYLDRLPDLLRSERQVQVWQPLRGDFVFAARGDTQTENDNPIPNLPASAASTRTSTP